MDSISNVDGTGIKPAFAVTGALHANIDMTMPSMLQGYIPPGEKQGKGLTGRVPLLFLALFIVFVGILWLGAPGKNGAPPVIKDVTPEIMFASVVFGVLFILAGWAEFSLLQLIENTPSAKIDSAAEGLNELSGKFIPEAGDLVVSPFGKKCIYYKVEFMRLQHSKNGSYWVPIASTGFGIPALFTDETGHIAIDLKNAVFDFNSKEQRDVYDTSNTKVPANSKTATELLNYIKSHDKSPVDFSKLNVVCTPGGSAVRMSGLGFSDPIAIRESIIGADSPYFAMGRIVGTAGTFNGKPVKLLITDPQTKLLSVKLESKEKAISIDRKLTYAAFGTGVILLLVGIALASAVL